MKSETPSLSKKTVKSEIRLSPRRRNKQQLKDRFFRLPKWMQVLIYKDMETSFENRIKVMESVVKNGL